MNTQLSSTKTQRAKKQTPGIPQGQRRVAMQAPRIAPKWGGHHRTLLSLQARLLSYRRPVGGETAPNGNGTHPADAGADEFGPNSDSGLFNALLVALAEIESAIERIEHGTFGFCEISEKPIPAERLCEFPWTRFTEEVERELKAHGATTHPCVNERNRVEAEPEEPSQERGAPVANAAPEDWSPGVTSP